MVKKIQCLIWNKNTSEYAKGLCCQTFPPLFTHIYTRYPIQPIPSQPNLKNYSITIPTKSNTLYTLCFSKSLTDAWDVGNAISTNLWHLLQEGGLHAASAQLVHPQGRLVLQRGTTRVECVGQVIVQQAADGGHVQVWVAAESAGKIGGVVTGTKDAAKLGVEQVLCHSSIRMSNKQNVLQNMFKL